MSVVCVLGRTATADTSRLRTGTYTSLDDPTPAAEPSHALRIRNLPISPEHAWKPCIMKPSIVQRVWARHHLAARDKTRGTAERARDRVCSGIS